MKAVDNDEEEFFIFKKSFLALSNDKLQAGIFTGPQIRALLKNGNFEKRLPVMELQAWKRLKAVIQKFPRSQRASNYEQLVSDILDAFQKLGYKMNVKIHFLHSHLTSGTPTSLRALPS